ncbi:hypothetical protein M378DRAFT_16664 [Amanita muscaria Koide BX008]|uniref:Uncharacterized protein n=1 Tax=Amanita muscaria (strain Koide BX008) TaxID=946122 RepID=A0A0C2S2J8_AMAMK|nr:hypothetical protein M378DRAFT_16664 [Amanita muscaria Koide BX008]
MGGVQSLTSSEGAIAATATLVVAGAVGYGVTTMSQQRSGRKDEGSSSRTGTGSRGKKKKKKQHDGVELDSCRSANESGVATVRSTTEQAETVTVVPFPGVIPGDFDVASTAASISSKGKVKDKGKGKAKQTAGDDGASSATPSESQHPSVLASGSKSKKAKKKKKPSGPASSSNLAPSLVASSSKVSTDVGQSRSAAPDKEENHPLQSSAAAIGLESKAAKSQDNLRSTGSSSTEDEGAKKKSSPGTSTIGVRTMPGVVPVPVIVHPLRGYVSSHDTDSSWTHVRRDGGNSKFSHLNQSSTSGISTTEFMTSDAGIGSSVTDDGYPSSPVVERLEDTEDEEVQEEGSGLASGYPRDTTNTQRRPLAERLLPKPRKTGVEDMLETPDHPSLARVMRVRPMSGEKPASGFSWADYEDVHVDEGAGHDADGEDDGWGVVRSRKSKSDRLPASAEANTAAPKSQVEKVSSGAMSKKQRQNAKKREAAKTAKADAEAQRISTLAKHKQQFEKDRTMEQISTTVGKAPSGGMKASVDSNGKLVWD